MSLNCFFGVELKPDGVPVTPLLPPHSSLVITQCSVTSVVPDAAPQPQDAEAEGGHHHHHHKKSKTEATHAAAGGEDAGRGRRGYDPVVLYVQGHELPAKFAVATLSPQEGVTYAALQLVFSQPVTFTLLPRKDTHANTATEGGACYPSVHLTGYYECEDEEDSSDEEAETDEEVEDADFEHGAGEGGGVPARGHRLPSSNSQQNKKKGGDGGNHKKKKH